MAYRKYRFRIGKDAHIRLRVKTNDVVLPLQDRDLSVELTDSMNKVVPVVFTTSGNMITFVFPGVDQKVCGNYKISVWENRGKERETVFDICNAFEIVRTTCQEKDLINGLDSTYLEYDVELEVITKNGIYSETIKYLDVMTADEYKDIEHRKDTLYVITRNKEDMSHDTQRSS